MPEPSMRERVARAAFVAGVGEEAAPAWDVPGEGGRSRWYAYADAILPLIEEAVTAERERCAGVAAAETDFTDVIHAEARRRYPVDHTVDDPFGATGEARSDPYGYDEHAREAFLAGALVQHEMERVRRLQDAAAIRGAREPEPATEVTARVYPFHQSYPGMPDLFHAACHEHPEFGFCGERVAADEALAVHLRTHAAQATEEGDDRG